jgi:hypothetical protein
MNCRPSKIGRSLKVFIPTVIVFSSFLGCKAATQSQVETFRATEQASPTNNQNPILMILDNKEDTFICKLSPSTQAKIEELSRLNSALFNAAQAFGGASPQSFSYRTQAELKRQPPKNFDPCSSEWEQWFLQSLATGRPAPLEIASVAVPHLAEIKAGVSGLGILAGRCGRPIEATGLALCAIGLSYAEDRGLIRPAD